jgi:hypothetical protein
LAEFSRTVAQAIKQEFERYIRQQKNEMRALNASVSIKQYRDEVGEPNLNIARIPAIGGIGFQINTMAKLKRIQIEIFNSNKEQTMNDMLGAVSKYNEELSESPNTTSTLITVSNTGLNKEKAIEELEQIGPEATSDIKLSGVGANGEKIDIGPDDIGIKLPVDNNLADEREKARGMLYRFYKSIREGIMRLPNPTASLEEIHRKFGRPNG